MAKDTLHYLDTFKMTYNDLVSLLGNPDRVTPDGSKTTCKWEIEYDGNVGEIYDWKEPTPPQDEPDSEIWWHIGGFDNNDLWTFSFIEDLENNEERNDCAHSSSTGTCCRC